MISLNDHLLATAHQVRNLTDMAEDVLQFQQRLAATQRELISTVETVAILMRHIPGSSAEEKYAYLCDHTDLSAADRMALWAVLSPGSGQVSEFDGEVTP